ncbi:MAG: hypothetical protein LBH76_07020, partial [Propionibacteriaceae bacterium]|jgi:hypothetical protein|nr:hypothetical protein [Propionibacteriaceae bacterium]
MRCGFAWAQAAAVQIANGRPTGRVAGAQLGVLSLGVGSAAVVAAAALAGAMGVYNRWAQFQEVLASWSLLAAFGAAAAVAGLALCQCGLLRRPVAQVMRGGRPYRLVTVTALVSQTVVLVAAMACVAGIVAMAQRVSADAAVDERWLAAGGTVRMDVSGMVEASDWADIDRLAERLWRGQAARGNAVLSQMVTIGDGSASDDGSGGPVYVQDMASGDASFPLGTWLNVNSIYLALNPVFSLAGERVENLRVDRDKAFILVPESLLDLVGEYADAFRDWGRALRQGVFPAAGPDLPFVVEVVPVAVGAGFFTYNPARPLLPQSVAAVFSDDLMDGMAAASALSQGAIVFPDAVAARDQAEAIGLTRYLSGVVSVADVGVAEARDRQARLALGAAAFLVLAFSLTLASVMLAGNYAQAHDQRIFVQTVHGAKFAHVHGQVLASAAVLWAVCFGGANCFGLLRHGWALAACGLLGVGFVSLMAGALAVAGWRVSRLRLRGA